MKIKSKPKRLHDTFYLKENRYKNTKESFKYLIRILKKSTSKNSQKKLADIGCANGELIYNIKKNFKKFEITGYDIRNDLLIKAKKNNSSDIKFKKIDIKRIYKVSEKFDIVVCSGVLSSIDEIEKTLSNLIKMTKKGGKIFIFEAFNPYPYNVFTKYINLEKPNIFQYGGNIFSIKYLKDFFHKRGLSTKFLKFQIKSKIPQRKDKLRAWTFGNKNKLIMNGLCFVQHQYWLIAKK